MGIPARAIEAMLALSVAGCAGRGAGFIATRRQAALANHGYVAARYDAIVAGDVIGDVKVWSSGAVVDARSGRTLVHVGFDLENNGPEPYELPPHEVVIEGATTDGARPGSAELYYQGGDGRVQGGRQGQLDLWFALPRGVKPRHLDAFQVRWAVRNAEGRYAQRTPFTEYEPPAGHPLADAAYYYHSPWYDPFLYAPPLAHVTFVHPMPYYYHRGRPAPRRWR